MKNRCVREGGGGGVVLFFVVLRLSFLVSFEAVSLGRVFVVVVE